MRLRGGVLAVALLAVVGVAALLLAAGSDGRSTAFSLDIPPSVAVLVLHEGQASCQGPITVPAAFRYVTPWISPSDASGRIAQRPIPGAAIDLTVRDAATNAPLARGQIAAAYVRPISPTVALDRTIPSGRRITVCLRSRGPGIVDLMGAPLSQQALLGDDGTASGAGQAALALLFLREHPRSLLSLVPTIFRRASLFRPGWVRPWTYWLLSAALFGAFVLAGVAVTRAARSDETSHSPQRDPVQ
jgi:hypothetical protein